MLSLSLKKYISIHTHMKMRNIVHGRKTSQRRCLLTSGPSFEALVVRVDTISEVHTNEVSHSQDTLVSS